MWPPLGGPSPGAKACNLYPPNPRDKLDTEAEPLLQTPCPSSLISLA